MVNIDTYRFMKNENNRVLPIEALRFLLMLVVCIWHFNSGMTLMHHGYLAVDFFFILSGFFLYQSATKKGAKSSLDYTLNKIKRYYPETIVVLLPLLIISWPRVLEEPHRLVNDLFFVTSSSVFGGGWNAPLWFLHIMILAGTILYPLVKNWAKISIPVILPCIFLFAMTCLLNYGGGKLEIYGIIGPFDCSLLRGLSEMSFGILTAAFWQRKSENVLNHKYGTALLNAISILCSFAFILLTIIQPCYDRYILIIAFFVIIGCSVRVSILSSIFKSQIWGKLGSLSFELYLVHFAIMKVLVRYLGQGHDWWVFVGYIVTVFIAAIMLRWFYTKVLKMKAAR